MINHRQRLILCLLASAFLHLGVLIYSLWWQRQVVETDLHPVFRAPPNIEADRFSPAPIPNQNLPHPEAQRLPSKDGFPLAVDIPLTTLSASPVAPSLPTPHETLALDEERIDAPFRMEPLPLLEDIQRSAVTLRARELDQYTHLWLPDADTSDAESNEQRRGRAVLLRAIEAMGGAKALAELKSRREGGAFYKSYGTVSKYAELLFGGARALFDGSQAWIEVHGQLRSLHGKSAREMERRASRWDFLSRYLGDGIHVRYAGKIKGEHGQQYDIVRVADLKFGGPPIKAYFDRQTHLLAAEEQTVVDTLPNGDWVKYMIITEYAEYLSEGKATVWHESETRRVILKTTSDNPPRWPPFTSTVNYSEIADSIFAVSHRNDPWLGLPSNEHEDTLWIEVEFSNRPMKGVPIFLGASNELTKVQKAEVTQQILATTIAVIEKLGWFQHVSPLDKDSPIHADDFILRVRMMAKKTFEEPGPGRVFYGVQLMEGISGRQVMGDGPLPPGYFGVNWGGDLGRRETPPPPENYFRRNCGFYACSVFIADDRLAYIDERQLAQFILRSYAKGSQVTKRNPPDLGNEFNRDCCYCQKP
jgi:hypothetical protein